MEPKYGIIGCGGISKFHFGGLEKIGAKIVHIADVMPERGKNCARAFNAKFTTDYKELLKDPDVSVVDVLTPTIYDKEICLAAIDAGKDVICEKILAVNAGEAVEIAKAVKKSKSLFFTAYMKRFFPAVQKAKELLPSLGILFSAYARSYQQCGNLLKLEEAPDKNAKAKGRGVVRDCGSHILDLICFLMGRPESVYANIGYMGDSSFDRKGIALFEYPGMLVVSFETVGHALEKIGYEKNSWDERIEINGTDGRVDIYTPMWNHPEKTPALLVHYDNVAKTSTEYRFDAVNPFNVEIEYFHKCLSERRQGNPDVIDGFNVDNLICAMEESHREKRAVKIDWKNL